jgi:predicted ATPase/DNA-binding CsgD family transcriptional regulator
MRTDDPSRQVVGDQLTQRELEVLRLMAAGLSNQMIAERLFLAFETVKWYLKQIYSKLHVSSRTQAIAAAHTAGLLGGTPANVESSAPLHNLPPQPTPFIGRASELAQLAERLNDPECQLLTVVGPGGVGKTRLVLEAATVQRTRFRDGVWFAALAPLFDPNLIPTVIAEAVRLSFAPGQPPKDQVLNYLRDRQMLLVLDNVEHLLAGVSFLSELLQNAPGVKLLVTSRERLQLQSEVVFRLAGLTVADWTTPEAAAESSAGKLFLQSARRLKPSFELTRDTLGALSAVCRLVRGMPLGILLAASWIDTLSLAEIAGEIERSFEFLESDWRDLPERQRSLRAVFEHSWSLLTEAEQSAMCYLSVCRGGFTREAAHQVAEASLKTLTSLVNKSLLSRDPAGRFDMHELLRQFSESKLGRQPDERQRATARHAAYYADFMDTRWRLIRSAQMRTVADDIELEIDNVRAAWDVIVDQGQFPQMAMVARVLWYFLMLRARYEEGINLFGRAVSKLRAFPTSETRDLALGEALHNLGFFYAANGWPDKGKGLAEESLAILRGHQAAEVTVRAHITLCRSEFLLGECQLVKQHAQRGIALAQHIGDPWYVGPCLFLLGLAAVHLGEYEEAYRAGEEALQYLEQAGDSYYQGLCCGIVLGRAALGMGQYEEAKQSYLRSIAYFESFNDPFEIAQSNRDLSEVYALTKDYDAAKRASQNSLRYYAKAGQTGFLISNLRPVARMFEMQAEYTCAVERLALLVNHPGTLPVDRQQAEATLARLRTSLSAEDFSGAYERGKALNLGEVVAELLQDG